MAYRKISDKAKQEIIKTIIEELEKGTPFNDACIEAGIDDATVYRWMQKDEKLAIRIEKAKAKFRRSIRVRVLRLLASYEKALGIAKDGTINKKLTNKRIKVLKMYDEHVKFLARFRLNKEFKNSQEVDVTSGGEPLKQYIVEIVEPKNKTKKLKNDKQSKDKGHSSTS